MAILTHNLFKFPVHSEKYSSEDNFPFFFHTILIVFIVVVVSTDTTVVHGKLTVRVTGV